MSSHERETGKVASSSDSIGDTLLFPRLGAMLARPPGIGIDALPPTLDGPTTGVDLGGGGGSVIPFSKRFSTWFSPCASVSLRTQPERAVEKAKQPDVRRRRQPTPRDSTGARWVCGAPLLQLLQLVGSQCAS